MGGGFGERRYKLELVFNRYHRLLRFSFPPPTLSLFCQNPDHQKTKSQEVLKTQGIALFSYPKANTSE